MKEKINIIFITILVFISTIIACKINENAVFNYLNNAELQYEGKMQEQNIVKALADIINLPKEQLKNIKYSNYKGKENQLDLQELIYKHFVPEKTNYTLGNNFYNQVKKAEVQKLVKKILKQIEQKPKMNKAK
ncbi:MAG: hypothetical protein JXR51_16280 [Bacteroidales bacterium]|nr:hypothetical protein [Bacteroidales bacterium]MBN2758724.1 hypothetical protein [Bacteroidales bacterium]